MLRLGEETFKGLDMELEWLSFRNSDSEGKTGTDTATTVL